MMVHMKKNNMCMWQYTHMCVLGGVLDLADCDSQMLLVCSG
jgi:hypothetical protein